MKKVIEWITNNDYFAQTLKRQIVLQYFSEVKNVENY
jgi:hypothetical protein